MAAWHAGLRRPHPRSAGKMAMMMATSASGPRGDKEPSGDEHLLVPVLNDQVGMQDPL